MRGSAGFQSDQGRAAVSRSLWSGRLLLPWGQRARRGRIRNALPVSRCRLHSAVVNPGTRFGYLSCGRGGRNDSERVPPEGGEGLERRTEKVAPGTKKEMNWLFSDLNFPELPEAPGFQ